MTAEAEEEEEAEGVIVTGAVAQPMQYAEPQCVDIDEHIKSNQ